MTERVDRIADALGGVDALLCFHGEGVPRPNVRYLSGFTGSSAALLVAVGHRLLITDGRYRDQAAVECSGWEIAISSPGEKLTDLAAEQCRSRGLGRVGYEPEGITAGMIDELRDSSGVHFMPVTGLVEERRRCKEADEIRAIAAAAAIADAALAATAALVRGSASERDIALELDVQMRRRGSEEPAFATMVAAGPRSALPHAPPTDRLLTSGDIVCIDCGATVNGYRSDLTRAWVVGEPTYQQIRMHEVVLRAHDCALALVRPGIGSAALNTAARAELAAAGIEEYWRHSIGHGVGLAIHEAPSLREGVDTELSISDVVTIEPGAYRTGWGGVRIEDIVVVTGDGARTLSAAPRELWVVGS